MSKNQPRTWSLVLTLGAPLGIVGLAAMIITFATLIDVARINGLPYPFMFPIVVDMGMIATMITAAQLQLRGLGGQWLAYTWFFFLSAVSVVANGTHALSTADMSMTTPVGASVIGAVPSGTLLVITHLVMKIVPNEKERAKMHALKEKELARQQVVAPARSVTPAAHATPAAAPVQASPALATPSAHPEPLRLVGDTQPVPSIAVGKDIARRRVVEYWAAEGAKPTGALVGEWLGGKSAKTGQRLLAEMETEGSFSAGLEERSLVSGS